MLLPTSVKMNSKSQGILQAKDFIKQNIDSVSTDNSFSRLLKRKNGKKKSEETVPQNGISLQHHAINNDDTQDTEDMDAEGGDNPTPVDNVHNTNIATDASTVNNTADTLMKVSEHDSLGQAPKRKRENSGSALDISIIDDSARHVHIRCTSEDNPEAFNKINSFRITEAVEDVIGWYPDGKTLDSGVLLIECESLTQVKSLLGLKTLCGLPVRAEIAFNIGTVRGVVRDARVCDIPEDVLLDRLREQHVVQVRPIMTGTGESRRRTEFLILSFRLQDLPEKILFGRERLPIVPYRVKVYQCTKCCSFGHRPDRCRRFKACAHCGTKGEGHNATACLESPAKCANCGGGHKATDKNCPRYVRQKAILKIKEEHKVGFRKAEEIFKKKQGERVSRSAPDRRKTAPPKRKPLPLNRTAAAKPRTQEITPAPEIPAPEITPAPEVFPPPIGGSYASAVRSPQPGPSDVRQAAMGSSVGDLGRRRRDHSMSSAASDVEDFRDLLWDSHGTGSRMRNASQIGRTDRVIVSPAREMVHSDNSDKIVICSPRQDGARHRKDISISIDDLAKFIKEFGSALTVENGKGDITISISTLTTLIAKYFINASVSEDWCQDVFRP